MLVMPLIVHHKTNPKLRAGIMVDKDLAMSVNPLTNQPQPVAICTVVWDESILDEATGELKVPEDKDRLPAVSLHDASELVFDGPYTPEAAEYDDEEEEEEEVEGAEVPAEETAAQS